MQTETEKTKPVEGQLVKREEVGAFAKSEPTVKPIGMAAEELVEYRRGFEGIAVQPFSKEAIEVLRRPIDPDDVEIKPDGVCYMPGVFYRSRLNEAFGPGAWAIAPRGPARRVPKSGGELIFFHGVLIVLGRFVSEKIGACMYFPSNRGMNYGDAYEGAITECLSRCVKDICPAVEVLWKKGWREEWTKTYAETYYDKREDKTLWRRKDSLRKSVLSPDAIPTMEEGPSVHGAGNAPSVARGPSSSTEPTGSSPPPAPESRPTEPAAKPPTDYYSGPATDSTLDKLEALVMKNLAWPPDYAGRWLFTNYQTRNPADLTEAKALDAIEKAKAHGPIPAK